MGRKSPNSKPYKKQLTVSIDLLDMSLVFRFEKLKPAVEKRKHKLQDSLHFFQFKFDVDEEVQWIKEKLPAAASTDYGKSLVDAQNLQKKHQVYFTSSF